MTEINTLYKDVLDLTSEMTENMNGLVAGSEELERQTRAVKAMFDSCVNYEKELKELELEKDKIRNEEIRLRNEFEIQSNQAQKELNAKYLELGVTTAVAVVQIAVGIWAFSFANVFEMEDTYSKQTSKQVVTKVIDMMKLRK